MALKVAIIGVSGYAKYVLDSFLRLAEESRIILAGATVINPLDAAETCAQLRRLSCRIFGDYEEMLRQLDGALDLCLIPTGIEWHRPMAEEALRRGAHVLVEKPLAGCVADAEAIIAAARRYGRKVMVGFQDLCSKPILEAKRRILRNEIGRLREVRAIGAWHRDFSYYQRNEWAGRLLNRGRAVFDSPLNNAFAHLLNLTLFLAGSEFDGAAFPATVEGRLYRAYPIESFDTASVHIRTEREIAIDCYVSHACEELIPARLIATGDHGSVEWRHEREISLLGADGGVRWTRPLESVEEIRSTIAQEVIRAIARDETLANTAGCALSHTMAIEKLHASSPIRNVPEELVLRGEDGLFIEGGAAELNESFENHLPLRLIKRTEPVERGHLHPSLL